MCNMGDCCYYFGRNVEYMLNNTRFDDCTPVIKFRGKIFCEKLYNISGNVCVKFQPYTITGYAEITQNV